MLRLLFKVADLPRSLWQEEMHSRDQTWRMFQRYARTDGANWPLLEASTAERAKQPRNAEILKNVRAHAFQSPPQITSLSSLRKWS